jgi:transposase
MVASLEEALQVIAKQSEMIAALQGQVESLEQSLKTSLATVAKQQHQIDQHLRRIYGASSERYVPGQTYLDPLLLQASTDGTATPQAEPSEADDESPVPERRPRKHTPHGRVPIPDHLERVLIELDLDEAERLCPRTGEPMIVIGYEQSEKIDYRPGQLVVNVYRRAKYASPDRRHGNDVGVLTAPMPDHPIPKCKADIGLVAHAIVSKFADHLPFYRQDSIFEREGVHIARSTLDGWALQTADALMPLGEALKAAVLDSDVLFSDDSIIPLLERGRGKTRKARVWVYVRGGPGPPLAAYDFTLDRRKQRPLEYLGDYQGYIHADACSGYDELFVKDGVVEVGCWCHARRGFDEAMTSRPGEASDILGRIRVLYKHERQIRDESPTRRHAYRQEHVRPVLASLIERVETLRPTTLPAEPLRKAIDYVLNQRTALQRFLDDGRLEADNNTAENAIRPLAIGRKNWLFAGSERGGRTAALYLGLIQSCKVCDVNPWAYFDDVLRRVMSHPVKRLRELLPDQWRPAERDARRLILSS